MGNLKRRVSRGRAIYRGLVIVTPFITRLPLRVARALGSAIGDLGFLVLHRQRGLAMTNVETAFSDWTHAKRRKVVRAMFKRLGEALMETIWLPNLTLDVLRQTTEISGSEYVDQALAAGRGAVIVTGHCGNWEWLGAAVALLGHPLTVLQRDRDEVEFNEYIIKLRARFGSQSIRRGSTAAALDMFRALKGGELLAFLIDQNIRAESVKVPFFGKPALTPIGPARLAVRAEAPVIICFIERRGPKHVITFHEPIFTSRDDDATALMARLTLMIEEQVRRCPEEWMWMHERWKERPKWDVSERKS